MGASLVAQRERMEVVMKTRDRKRLWVGGVVLVALVWLGSCEQAAQNDFEEGPPLVVDVPEDSLAVEPTGVSGDPSRCCCLVVGDVVNESVVAVHVTVQVEAFATGEEEPVGTAVDFVNDLQPSESRRIAASGLLIPCDDIDRLELVDVDVRGIWFP